MCVYISIRVHVCACACMCLSEYDLCTGIVLAELIKGCDLYLQPQSSCV